MQERWQKEAAQIGGAALAQVLTEMRDAQRQMILVVEGVKERDLSDRAAIDKIMAGFPAGDFEGHRRYHESVIEWRELRNKMVREGLIKVAQAGALTGAGLLIGIIWKAFKISVTQ
jgi:hypothetical protein